MKITEVEVSVFRAIVKGLGIYQLTLSASDLFGVLLEKTDIRHFIVGAVSHQGEYVAWTIFHICVGLILLLGTNTACRLAFPPDVVDGKVEANRV
ncbi:MAG TPA: hypothetical protein VGM64_09040 [Lacunisphaera sp.]|jgi:hypothetical protein